eukprot:15384-Prorocentrum_minimum.AAC.1
MPLPLARLRARPFSETAVCCTYAALRRTELNCTVRTCHIIRERFDAPGFTGATVSLALGFHWHYGFTGATVSLALRFHWRYGFTGAT